jgi:hypothetical protein
VTWAVVVTPGKVARKEPQQNAEPGPLIPCKLCNAVCESLLHITYLVRINMTSHYTQLDGVIPTWRNNGDRRRC